MCDKDYFSRDTLKELDGSEWKTRIAEPKRKGLNWWHGDHEARRAVYNNRVRIGSGIGKATSRRRTELVERSFEHCLDRCGGMRRAWLRGVENLEKRYLIHVAGFNLGLLMRHLTGVGTPREAAALSAWLLTTQFGGCFWLALVVIVQDTRRSRGVQNCPGKSVKINALLKAAIYQPIEAEPANDQLVLVF